MDFIIGNSNYIAKACQRKGVILHAKRLPSHLTTEAKKTSGMGPVCCAALSGDVRLLYNLLSVTCHKPPSQRRFQMTTQLSFRFGGSVFTSHEIFRLENSTYSTLKMQSKCIKCNPNAIQMHQMAQFSRKLLHLRSF